MLLRNLGLLRYDPLAFFQLLAVVTLGIMIAITVHEFSHALAAHLLGDDTARRQGRLSLNPVVHLDPWGTLFLFMVGFGWGKPVPVNIDYLRGGEKGMAKVALAGPLSGLVAAGLASLLFRATGGIGGQLLFVIILFNILLSIFNLIPLPPLDGYRVALGFLPASFAYSFRRLEYYGAMPLMLLIFLDIFLRVGVIWGVIRPAVNFFGGLFLGGRLL